MTTTAPRFRFRLRAALLLLLAISTMASAPLAHPTSALAAQDPSAPRPSSFVLRPSSAPALQEATRTTDYFTIYYPKGEEKTALWYAGFVDEVNRAVSELLGAQPLAGMSLYIYATEPDFWRANPMAEMHPGILAHAIPERKEIGVSVKRLRAQPPALARESFRHEITHVVAGSLSNQQLPIAFHEGLGQYNELSSTRAEETAAGLLQAQSAGIPYLSWTDLNKFDTFRQNIEVAYPQSYSVMAFLADRYGMEPFARFLAGLRDDLEYRHAILLAYGKPVETLEKEWLEYLPGFLESGWKKNVLSANDLDYGLALMGGGKFAEAEEHFRGAERLYNDLGRRDRAAQASTYLASATKAKEAERRAAEARANLEAYDYANAYTRAISASEDFSALSLPDYQQYADKIAALAEKGNKATSQIEKARASMKSFDLNLARAAATEAGRAFSDLGDARGVAEANAILADIWSWQQTAGFGIIGAGGLLLAGMLVGGSLAVIRARKRKSYGTNLAPIPLTREENQSWL